MPGLIPLMLSSSSPGSRSSAMFADLSTPYPIRASWGPETSKQKTMKRMSQPTLTPLSILPLTPADWRRTVAEIKRQHVNRRYRSCSVRCIEIIDNIKDTSKIEPAYLIYLHFYAASSLEMCARPLPSVAPSRARLLRQARSHYTRAETLISSAEQVAASNSRPLSQTSTDSSLHSPSESVSSHAWTADTGVSSPRDSLSSFDGSAKAPKTEQPEIRRKKKVSFSLPVEPYIRPDSPTLGFDDEYFIMAAATRTELPRPPTPAAELPRVDEADESGAEGEPGPSDDEDFTDPLAHSAVSRRRYRTHLSTLKAQIAGHIAALDAADSEAGDGAHRHTRTLSSLSSSSFGSAGSGTRSAELQARIERLRSSGWQRKRFDARRYEELCDTVIAELDA